MQIKKFFEKFLIFSPFVFVLFVVIYISAANIEISNVPNVNLYTTDGIVNSIVTDTKNDKIYIGGDFSYVGPYAGGAAVVDAETGTLINVGLDIVGSVYTAIPDGNGGLYIGGDFTSINGYGRAGLAHINPDYTLDTNFSFDVVGVVHALNFYNGQLYIGGDFTSINDFPVVNLAIINMDKFEINSNFHFDINDPVFSLLIDPEASILYIGGAFDSINTVPMVGVAKMDLRNMVFDETFDIDIKEGAILGLVQDKSYIYFVGNFSSGNSGVSQIGRFDIGNEKVDQNFIFDDPGINVIKDVVIYGGDMYVAGDFIFKNDVRDLAKIDLEKLSIDLDFSDEFNGGVNKILISGDHLYVVGDFNYKYKDFLPQHIIKIDLYSGVLEDVFYPNPNDSVNTIALIGDGLFLAGDFNRICGENISNLARIDATTGIVDRDFNIEVDGIVNTMILDNDSLYIGGEFDLPVVNLAKINTITNSVDEFFVVDLKGAVNTLLSNAGNLYIGGEFDSNLLVVNNQTGEKSSFIADLDGPVHSMAISKNGLYVGGNFKNNFAFVDLNTGAFVEGFTAKVDGAVNAIGVDNDVVYIGGDFLTVNGDDSPYLAKINNQTGDLIKDFSVFPNALVKTLMIHRDNLYIGGEFSKIGDINISRLAKIDISTKTGDVDNAFVVNPDEVVNALDMNDNNLYVGGKFGFIGTYRAPSFASFSWSDKTPPTITILGENPLSIEQNSWYQDFGATAIDNNNQDITNSIVTSGSVDVTKPGTYTIRYSVSDLFGRTSIAERIVNVTEVSIRESGGGLPPQAFISPQNPKPTAENPKGKLGFIINKNEKITYSNVVTLQFFADSDTKKVAISEDPNFKYASIEEYSDTKQFKLSDKYGEKIIYVKFYTEYGVSSEPISKIIIFSEEIKSATTREIKQNINIITGSIDKIKTVVEQKSSIATEATTTSTELNKIVTPRQVKEELDTNIEKIEISKNLIEKSISEIDQSTSGGGVKVPQIKKIINKIDSNIKETKKTTAKIKNNTPIEQDIKKDIGEKINSIQKNIKAIETTIDKKPVNYSSSFIIENKTGSVNQNEKIDSAALKVINSFIKTWKGFLGKIFK